MYQTPTVAYQNVRFIHEESKTTLDCSKYGNFLVLNGSGEPLPIFDDGDLHHYLNQEAISLNLGWQTWTVQCRSCAKAIDPNEKICLKCKIEALLPHIWHLVHK